MSAATAASLPECSCRERRRLPPKGPCKRDTMALLNAIVPLRMPRSECLTLLPHNCPRSTRLTMSVSIRFSVRSFVFAVAVWAIQFSTLNVASSQDRPSPPAKIDLQDGDTLVFSQDYRFKSPSLAASVVVGGVRGRGAWKDATGRTLRSIQNERA